MKRAGKLISAAMMLAVFAAVFVTGAVGTGAGMSASAAGGTLVVYNWGDYIDEDIIAAFEQEYGIDVTYSTYDTNEVMLTTIELGSEAVDLICPSEYAIQRLMQRGLLQKLDTTRLTNIGNVDSRIYDKVDQVFTGISVPEVGETESMSDYFVPYMWGTLGILYNTEVVTDADLAEGYGLLWNAAGNDALDGKILMKDSVRDAFVAAVLYLKENDRLPAGYESLSIEELINTIDDTLLAAAEEVFTEQKEVIAGYEVDFGKTDMVNGTAYVDLAWSGDALYAMEDSDSLDYFVPKIGGNIWFDGWAIPKNAANVDNAYLFLDYLCRPEVAMANSMYIGYTSALSANSLRADETAMGILAENDYTADEFFGDAIRYPDISQANLGVMKDFGDRNEAAIAMWERVKSPDAADLMWILWVVIGVVGAAAIGVGIYFIVRKKGSVRRVSAGSSVVAAGTGGAADSDDESEDEESDGEA